MAKLVSYRPAAEPRKPAQALGLTFIADDFDAPMPEVEAAFEGRGERDMRILLDTYVFIWWDDESPALTGELREATADSGNEIHVSAASVWEIAIKQRSGKIAFAHGIKEAVARNRFLALTITPDHAEHDGGLPPHHRDPFDRMLVAQAVLERMVLGTQDRMMRPYGVVTIGLPPN